MALQEKYQEIVDAANASGVTDLQVREQDNVLYIDGTAPSGAVKDNLWQIYDKLDPNYLTGDLIMNINVTPSTTDSKATVVTEKSNLNVRKGPGTDQPIIGKAAHDATVTVISQTSELWWQVRTEDGVEGYCFAQYLKLQ